MADSQIYFHKKRILARFYFSFVWVCLLVFVILCSFFMENILTFPERKFFYVPPPDYLKIVSGSFRSFCADMFYIRGVLAVAEKIEDTGTWVDWVQKNFETATSLDPELTQSYFFAGVVIGRDEESINKGIQFLEKGFRRNPDEWQLPYWLGFNYYQLGNYLKAIEFYQRASLLPGAPDYLKSNQAMLYYKAGRPDLGRVYLEGFLRSVEDSRQLKWIETKLRWLDNIVYLEEKVRQFRKAFGFWPQELEELVKTGILDEIPEDPFGKGYYLDKDSHRVKSRFN